MTSPVDDEVARHFRERIDEGLDLEGGENDEIPDWGDDEQSEPRDSAAILLLISAFGLSLAARAFDARAGRGLDSFVDGALSDLTRDLRTAFTFGERQYVQVDILAADAYASGAAAAQLPYLEKFEADLTGPTPPSDKEIVARSNLFAGALWPSYQQGRVQGAVNVVSIGAFRNVELWVRWDDSNDARECGDCRAVAKDSPWRSDEIPFFPGDGHTVCLGNCRCELEIEARRAAA